MAENPAGSAILAIRRDLSDFITKIGNGATIEIYADQANAQVKRDLRDTLGIKWAQVYNAATANYFLDTDGDANNKDRIQNMIALLCIAYVFRDYSIKVTDSSWFDLYVFYEEKYQGAMKQAKLDVDQDENGSISEGEEMATSQSFLVR